MLLYFPKINGISCRDLERVHSVSLFEIALKLDFLLFLTSVVKETRKSFLMSNKISHNVVCTEFRKLKLLLTLDKWSAYFIHYKKLEKATKKKEKTRERKKEENKKKKVAPRFVPNSIGKDAFD